MDNSPLKEKKTLGQAILELSIVFIAMVLFIVGIIRMWCWSSSQMAGRQLAYEGTRLAAGSSNPGFWGVYTPSQLTEEWVFAGFPGRPGLSHSPSGTVDSNLPSHKIDLPGGNTNTKNLFHLSPQDIEKIIDSAPNLDEAIVMLNDSRTQLVAERGKWNSVRGHNEYCRDIQETNGTLLEEGVFAPWWYSYVPKRDWPTDLPTDSWKNFYATYEDWMADYAEGYYLYFEARKYLYNYFLVEEGMDEGKAEFLANDYAWRAMIKSLDYKFSPGECFYPGRKDREAMMAYAQNRANEYDEMIKRIDEAIKEVQAKKDEIEGILNSRDSG